jgi:hypothetical protein
MSGPSAEASDAAAGGRPGATGDPPDQRRTVPAKDLDGIARAAALIDYCSSQDGLFVIPIEALGEAGMDPEFAAALLARGLVKRPWIRAFDAAFRAYGQRCAELNRQAPRHWFPPRVQHVCVITRPDVVRPYFEPFRESAWLFYAADFDPKRSSLELSTYLFLHAERMALFGEIVPTLVANLGYFLTLDEAMVADFVAGCQASNRPDAAGFRALARAMPGIRRLYHQDLKPPAGPLPDAGLMPHTGLILPAGSASPLQKLEEAWSEATMTAFQRHLRAHARPSPDGAARVLGWLRESAPQVLVCADEGAILWSPDAPGETANLESALEGITESGASNILADLAVIDRHTRRFLACLRQPEALVDPAPYITASGLSFIHKDRKLVGYGIGPGENAERLWQPTPPYERFMLAARTVHEWGHLAAESNWIGVPEPLQAQFDAKSAELAALLETVLAAAPPEVQARAQTEVASLREKKAGFGGTLVKRMLVRSEDYMANLLARRFLSADEMDTYVRNNVSSHVLGDQPDATFHQILRLAYEFQYLSLARIERPWDWFLASSWFVPRFVDRGVLTLDQFRRMVALVGEICACYRIEERWFDWGGLAGFESERPEAPDA